MKNIQLNVPVIVSSADGRSMTCGVVVAVNRGEQDYLVRLNAVEMIRCPESLVVPEDYTEFFRDTPEDQEMLGQLKPAEPDLDSHLERGHPGHEPYVEGYNECERAGSDSCRRCPVHHCQFFEGMCECGRLLVWARFGLYEKEESGCANRSCRHFDERFA